MLGSAGVLMMATANWRCALCWLAGLSLLVGGSAACAALTPVGNPPAVRFGANTGNPQNFAVAQDSTGIVYVANGSGVLEFDGERWQLITMPNQDTARSLAIDANDRVYVGGFNAFGYLQRDPTGRSQVVDLTHRFEALLDGREFSTVWRVVLTPEGVYFGALRDLFFWDPETEAIGYWQHEGRFGDFAHTQGQTIGQFRGEGFRRRLGEEWVPIPSTAQLTTLIYQLLPMPDGSLLTLGIDGAWMRIDGDQVSPVQMPVNLPDSSNFEAAMSLADGTIILGAGDGQVHVVNPQRTAVRRFSLDSGFLCGIAPANGGGFLACADEAIFRVAWPSEWSVVGVEHGLSGNLLDMGRWRGVDYVLSSAGILQLIAQDDSTPKIEAVPWVDGLVVAMHELSEQRALIAEAHKLLLVENEQTREVSAELMYPRGFYPSRFIPKRIYIATENGLRYLDQRGEELLISPPPEQKSEFLVGDVHEVSANELWFASYRHGLWRARLDRGGVIVEQTRFGPEQGLDVGEVAATSIAEISDGRLIVSTRRGLFRWTGERFVRESLDGLDQLREDGELLIIAGDAQGTLWAYSSYRVFRFRPDSGWRLEPVDQLRQGAISSLVLRENGSAMLVANLSVLMYSGGQPGERYQPQVHLRSVALNWNDGSEQMLPLHPPQPVEIPYGTYGINFQFALPDLAYQSGRAYRGRLLGYEEDFSAWRTSRGYLYSRMSPGTYTLEIQARDGAGQISQTQPYTLIILAPWYRSWWAISLATLAALILLLGSIRRYTRSRTRRLAEEKRQLETTVAERTRDLAAANQRLQMIAHVDGLTGVANRRRLDQYLDDVWRDCRNRGRPLALLAIDVDHFKRFNDSQGHLAGDQYLKSLMPILDGQLRRSEDLLARYGGEEFVAIMPGADLNTAAQVAEAMRHAVEAAALGTTVSIGVASAIPNGGDPKHLVARADQALYRAKSAGRNRVELYDPELSVG